MQETQETRVRSLGRKDPLEKEMATCFSVLAWRIVSINLQACVSEGKVSACNVGDLGSIPGSERSPGEGNGNSLQYSCLENLMDREAW